jgi:DNA sulfur modification protein DndC
LSDENEVIEEISFVEKVRIAKEDLKKLYLNSEEERDWAMAWSGGKDSTVVVGLAVAMLKELEPSQRKRKIHAVMSDTVVENPILDSYMHDQVKKLNDYIEKENLPMTAQMVKRTTDNSYFYYTLGRGYFLPMNNGQGRWCTDRLKIKPQNKALSEINPSFLLIGTRLSESNKRRQSIEKWSGKNELDFKIGDHVSLPNTKTFMAIVDFDVEDVWAYLQKYPLGWSTSHAVRKLYKDATGECGFSNPKGVKSKVEGCGARFGCWLCPVILQDKSTEKMSETYDWMTPLTYWRQLQLMVYGDFIPAKKEGMTRKERSEQLKAAKELGKRVKYITKSGHKRNGKRITDKQGNIRDDQGTFTVEAREYLFNKLLETQRQVNLLRVNGGIEGLKLISNEEIEIIQQVWELDRKTAPWLVTNVNGISISEMDGIIEEYKKLI